MAGQRPYQGLARQLVIAELAAAGIVFLTLVLVDLHQLVLEFLLALVAAVVLEPFVRLVMRLHVPRTAAVAAVVLVAAVVVVGVLLALSLPVAQAVEELVRRLPALVAELQHRKTRLVSLLERLHLERYVTLSAKGLASLASHAVAPALVAARSLVSLLVGAVITATLALFLSLEGPRAIAATARELSSEKATKLAEALHEMALAVTGYVLGNLATSLVAGLVVYVTFRSLGLPFALVVALFVGLVDLIPLVGGLLAGIPSVGLALLGGIGAAIVVLVVFLLYQQVENHLLNPLIMSRTVQLNPLWVLIAVLIGGALASVLGALIAIPVASALQVLARKLVMPWLRARLSA